MIDNSYDPSYIEFERMMERGVFSDSSEFLKFSGDEANVKSAKLNIEDGFVGGFEKKPLKQQWKKWRKDNKKRRI